MKASVQEFKVGKPSVLNTTMELFQVMFSSPHHRKAMSLRLSRGVPVLRMYTPKAGGKWEAECEGDSGSNGSTLGYL